MKPPRLPYNVKAKCMEHRAYIAAVCPKCYDRALRQQQKQLSEERKRAHEAYLKSHVAAA